jgi:ABC-type anion transport system duplicated permease subunit
LDDLFASAHQHLAAAQYAAHALPFEVLLLSMLLEEHKEVMRLRQKVDSLIPPND